MSYESSSTLQQFVLRRKDTTRSTKLSVSRYQPGAAFLHTWSLRYSLSGLAFWWILILFNALSVSPLYIQSSRLSCSHCPATIEGGSVNQHRCSHSDSIWPWSDTMWSGGSASLREIWLLEQKPWKSDPVWHHREGTLSTRPKGKRGWDERGRRDDNENYLERKYSLAAELTKWRMTAVWFGESFGVMQK